METKVNIWGETRVVVGVEDVINGFLCHCTDDPAKYPKVEHAFDELMKMVNYAAGKRGLKITYRIARK